jgi:3'-phosphoadenosine 5'-phosphosulfate sulfotransferase (PAPS reductase)/FAD synthetase
MSKRRITEWYDHWEGEVYVSFSGGKDSTVLLHLVRELYPDVEAVFVDTGLEYPEIRDFVKTIDNVTWIKPKMPFNKVIEKYGYPIISKEQALFINQYMTTRSEKLRRYRWEGCPLNGSFKISEKWKHLTKAPFKISEKCCDIMKKQPFKLYEKSNKKLPFIGTMAAEGRLRFQAYEQHGCNAFDVKRPKSAPLSIWLDKDIWSYINKYNVKYSNIYDMGYKRTGCMFCLFGLHLEAKPNRLDLMKKTHPKQYKYCMEKLGLEEVLKWYMPQGEFDF